MDKVDKAFTKIKRENFVPDEIKYQAGYDIALPIGYGQTISQPYTVRLMLGWLDPQPGEKILDVGSGSGWTSSLLSYLVGSKGLVHAVELVPELLEFGKQNSQRLGIKNIKFHKSGKSYGWPLAAPFDRILVSASADKLHDELLDQLKPNGKMVVPVRDDILEITKKTNSEPEIITHSGFVFVPLLQG